MLNKLFKLLMPENSVEISKELESQLREIPVEGLLWIVQMMESSEEEYKETIINGSRLAYRYTGFPFEDEIEVEIIWTWSKPLIFRYEDFQRIQEWIRCAPGIPIPPWPYRSILEVLDSPGIRAIADRYGDRLNGISGYDRIWTVAYCAHAIAHKVSPTDAQNEHMHEGNDLRGIMNLLEKHCTERDLKALIHYLT